MERYGQIRIIPAELFKQEDFKKLHPAPSELSVTLTNRTDGYKLLEQRKPVFYIYSSSISRFPRQVSEDLHSYYSASEVAMQLILDSLNRKIGEETNLSLQQGDLRANLDLGMISGLVEVLHHKANLEGFVHSLDRIQMMQRQLSEKPRKTSLHHFVKTKD